MDAFPFWAGQESIALESFIQLKHPRLCLPRNENSEVWNLHPALCCRPQWESAVMSTCFSCSYLLFVPLPSPCWGLASHLPVTSSNYQFLMKTHSSVQPAWRISLQTTELPVPHLNCIREMVPLVARPWLWVSFARESYEVTTILSTSDLKAYFF